MMRNILGSSIGIIGYLVQVIGINSEIVIKIYKLADKYGNRNKHSLAAYGLQLLYKEKYQDALYQFKKINIKNKKNYLDRVVITNKALAFWKLDKIDKSIELIEDLRHRYNYLNEEILTSLGYFYLENGNYIEALNITKQVLKVEPGYIPALDNLGQIYYQQGDLDKAEYYFLKVLKSKNLVDSNYYLGLIYEKQGKRKKAKKYFEKVSKAKVPQFSTINKKKLIKKYKEYKLE